MSRRESWSTAAALLALALFVLVPMIAGAQTYDRERAQKQTEGTYGQTGQKSQADGQLGCDQIMQMHKNMQAEQQRTESRLNDLVSRMQSTSGEVQQEAMAELLATLVEQHRANEKMTQMQPLMWQHMMQHVHSGEEMSGMAECPAMGSGSGNVGWAESRRESGRSVRQ